MAETMHVPGKRVKRKRLVRAGRFIVEVEVEAVMLDGESSEVSFEPHVVELLRQVEVHARDGDIEWLKRHGKVYVEAA